jgi:hypothetical protein
MWLKLISLVSCGEQAVASFSRVLFTFLCQNLISFLWQNKAGPIGILALGDNPNPGLLKSEVCLFPSGNSELKRDS